MVHYPNCLVFNPLIANSSLNYSVDSDSDTESVWLASTLYKGGGVCLNSYKNRGCVRGENVILINKPSTVAVSALSIIDDSCWAIYFIDGSLIAALSLCIIAVEL